jgi:hypothetical protein
MTATLYPLLFLPKPWHTLGLDYLTHLHVSNGFDIVLIMVDHLTRMARFLPCTQRAWHRRKLLICFYMESTDYTDYLECWLVTAI